MTIPPLKNIAAALAALFVSAAAVYAQASAASEPVGSAATPTVTLKVMSINIRHNVDFWEERLELLADEIARLQPDIIGVQEVAIGAGQGKMLQKLVEERNGPDGIRYDVYQRLKTGAYGMSGEGVAIFSRFPIVKRGFADLEMGRVVVFNRVSVADGLTVDVYNTHLHHQGGDEVTLPQMEKTLEFMKKNEAGNAVVLTGDMNSAPDSATIALLPPNGFVDTYLAFSGGVETPEGMTSPVPLRKTPAPLNTKSRIDYIFIRPAAGAGLEILDSLVCFKTPSPEGLYPSDHLGVMTTFRLPAAPPPALEIGE